MFIRYSSFFRSLLESNFVKVSKTTESCPNWPCGLTGNTDKCREETRLKQWEQVPGERVYPGDSRNQAQPSEGPQCPSWWKHFALQECICSETQGWNDTVASGCSAESLMFSWGLWEPQREGSRGVMCWVHIQWTLALGCSQSKGWARWGETVRPAQVKQWRMEMELGLHSQNKN